MIIEEILQLDPFYTPVFKKNELLLHNLKQLCKQHLENCQEYKSIINSLSLDVDHIKSLEQIPFLPVGLFKEYDLKSINKSEIHKTVQSSGTTSQSKSKIYLDRQTSALQSKVLAKILSSYLGQSRLPTIIIDTRSIVENSKKFSARSAGIQGFSLFSKDRFFALDENMKLDYEGLKEFSYKYKNQKILIFGFTFMIWQYFLKQVNDRAHGFDFAEGILFHGGGWKKLIELNISDKEFKSAISKTLGVNKVYNYYGMAEQTGSIFVECEEGFLHPSIFGDVIVRNPANLTECDVGQKGIIQVLSMLPKSYPGHSLLTEDEGSLFGYDGCKCGRSGRYFEVHGRLPSVELRGCSDTYE